MSLANTITVRLMQSGDLDDLDEAIVLHRQFLALRPLGHPDRATSLLNLADSLLTSFGETEELSDLDEVVTMHREALSLYPLCHLHRPISLAEEPR